MNKGIKELLYQIRWLFIPYLLILIVCLVIKLNFSKEEIYFAVNSRNTWFGDELAPFFTDLGDGLTIIALSVVLLFISYRKSFLLITSYAITSIIAQLAKHLFDAPRPFLYFHSRVQQLYLVKGIQMLSLHSFPSGHTVTAFSAAVVLTVFCKNRKWGILLLIVAVLVGYSRMYLSEHFFEDVIAGSVIGFFITVLWLNYIDNRTFIHSANWSRSLLKIKKDQTSATN